MYANPRKTTSARQLGPVAIGDLLARVMALTEAEWQAENASKPNRFDALDRTEHVVFRFVDRLDDWRSSHDRPLWASWKDVLEPVLEEATRHYGYKRGMFPRIMLAKMAPGGVIHPHIDASPSAKWPHKIHVPLVTNDKVYFYIKPNHHHFPVGHAVEVNNLDVHAVENRGGTDRIHLIFEYYDPDQPSWLDDNSRAPGSSTV